MPRRYRVGIVGCGRIASLYEADQRAKRYFSALTHASAYTQHSRVEMVAGCDVDPRRLAAFGDQWGVKSLYSDVLEMLERENIDILSICTQVESHLPIIEMAASRVGLIFCEKPLALSLGEVERAGELCWDQGSKLAVNLFRQFDPSHREVASLVQEGDLGRIQSVHCYYGKGLLNIGSHLVGVLVDILGEPIAVQALASVPSSDYYEESIDFSAEFPHGVRCVAQAVDFAHFRLFELDLVGETGRIVISDEGLRIRRYRVAPNRAETGYNELREMRPAPKATVGESLYWAVDELVRSLDEGREPRSSGAFYTKVQRVLDSLRESAGHGGLRIRIAAKPEVVI